jgi:hypothetical protein
MSEQEQQVVLAERSELTEEYWQVAKRIDEHSDLIAQNLTFVKAKVQEQVKPLRTQLEQMRKVLPKPSEIYKALDTDALESARDLRVRQVATQKEIRDSGIVKQINNVRKEFPEHDIFCRKKVSEANVASVLIAEDRVRQLEIDSLLGYKKPAEPSLHKEML